MDTTTDENIISFSKRLKEAIPDAQIYLFGSRARDEHLHSSDYDFIVISESFKGLKTPRRLEEVHKYWDGKLNADIIPYTPAELKKQRQHITIAKKAMQEAIKV